MNGFIIFVIFFCFSSVLSQLEPTICNYYLNISSSNNSCDNVEGCTNLQAVIEAIQKESKCNYFVVHISPGTYTGSSNCAIKLSARKIIIEFVAVNESSVIFDAEGASSIFEISGDVSFRGIVFKNGKSSLTGGCISIDNGNVGFVDCLFVNCQGLNGGAIFSTGSVSFSHSSCEFCSAELGGAIYVRSGDLHIVDGSFYLNGLGSGTSLGGAVYANNSTVLITNSTFNSNMASSGGAAYFNEFVYLKINDTSFRYNSAEYGGALFFSPANPNATFSLSVTDFTNNNATEGGAFYCQSNSTTNTVSPNLSDLTFSFNSATDCFSNDFGGQNCGSFFSQCFNHDLVKECYDCPDHNCYVDPSFGKHCLRSSPSNLCLCSHSPSLLGSLDIIIQIISGSVCFVMIAIIICLYFSNWTETDKSSDYI